MEHGMIRALLSPVDSAVSCWVPVDCKWPEEGHQAILSGMKSELDLIKKGEQNPVSIHQ